MGSRDEFGWLQCRSGPCDADPCANLFRGFIVALLAEVLDDTGFEQLTFRHHSSYGHCARPKNLLDTVSDLFSLEA